MPMNVDVLSRLLNDTDVGASRLLLVYGSRGSGKSWWADQTAEQARAAGFAVHRVAGRSQSGDAVLRSDAMATDARACIVVDDVDCLDEQVRRDLRATIDAIGAIGVVSAGSASAFDGALAIRLEPLSVPAVVELLRTRGVGMAAAQRCAVVSGGNPGLALSLADGLSDGQRSGHAAVPEMPRLAADVAADLHLRLRHLDERTCRALVVAAAADDGDLVAVGAALRELGEAGTSSDGDSLEGLFDAAEEAAVVDIVGSRLSFVDPWMRLAAYYLVAPASRRAAHRALAAAYASPRQGRERVRHLVAASSGPSDEIAAALAVVAAASARRGDRLAAAQMALQAAELAVANDLRSSCLLRSIGWCLDGGDYGEAERLTHLLDGREADEHCAIQEVNSLLHGDTESAGPVPIAATSMSERELATWQGRRHQRMQWWGAAEGGNHARLIHQIGGTSAAPAELWARGQALRDGGFVRDAAELTGRVLGMLPSSASHVRNRWELLDADLSVLAWRDDPVAEKVKTGGGAQARSIAARAALAASPSSARDASSVHVPAHEPLRGIRSALLRGLSAGDHQVLAATAQSAEALGLPIEAGDGWLMAAEAARANAGVGGSEVVAGYLDRAVALFHRCAVRGWDGRLRHLMGDARSQSVAPAAAADAALDALSAAEWRVAGSVAEGLTNREVAAALFLSVKTVDFHLQQIYRKLALRSRTELAVRVAGHPKVSARRDAPRPGETRR